MKRTKGGARQFSREFKLAAVKRIEDGEKPSVVARSLRVKMELIGRWRRLVQAGGEQALKGVGRPKAARTRGAPPGQGDSRLAYFERLGGRQQAASGFFEHTWP